MFLAPRSVPMVPPAPPMLSTTTCWPSSLPSASATRRAITSLVPPAGNGLTIFSGLLGQLSWACGGQGQGSRRLRGR
jgi:hypothetical protein